MVEAAEGALASAADKTIDDIRHDRALALVLVKFLEMLGEAAYKLSRNFRDVHPEIPWTVLVQLRNHLVHEYHDIDIERVWSTIRSDVPALLPALRSMFPRSDGASE